MYTSYVDKSQYPKPRPEATRNGITSDFEGPASSSVSIICGKSLFEEQAVRVGEIIDNENVTAWAHVFLMSNGGRNLTDALVLSVLQWDGAAVRTIPGRNYKK